jgi:uncharacterized membrane protein
MAINNHGEIVGYTSTGETPSKDNPDPSIDGRWLGSRDPNTLDFGLLPKNGHAFYWKRGVVHDLGALSRASAALAVNDAGSIVGGSDGRAVGWILGWGTHRGEARSVRLDERGTDVAAPTRA